MILTTKQTDALREFVREHGAAAGCELIASICEQIRDTHQFGSQQRTTFDINAGLLRQAMGGMV